MNSTVSERRHGGAAAKRTKAHAAPKPAVAWRGAPGPAAEPTVTQVRQAYARIEEKIATLELVPGQVVSENMLAALLGLGRTPVREALQQLAREGLVVILPKRGIVISAIDVKQQLKLLEFRRHVERCVVTLAARRADDGQRERLRALAAQMDEAARGNDGVAFLALDGEFNQLVLDCARNDFAAASMRAMQSLSRRFWFAHYRTVADVPETARLHATIARAVAEGDEGATASAIEDLLDNVEAFTRATLD